MCLCLRCHAFLPVLEPHNNSQSSLRIVPPLTPPGIEVTFNHHTGHHASGGLRPISDASTYWGWQTQAKSGTASSQNNICTNNLSRIHIQQKRLITKGILWSALNRLNVSRLVDLVFTNCAVGAFSRHLFGNPFVSDCCFYVLL